MRAGIINKLINACADVFCQNYEAIMKGDFNSTLIKQVSGTNKEAYDACTALAYGRIYHTNMVTQIQIAGFKILGTILKEYTDAVLKPVSYTHLCERAVFSPRFLVPLYKTGRRFYMGDVLTA